AQEPAVRETSVAAAEDASPVVAEDEPAQAEETPVQAEEEQPTADAEQAQKQAEQAAEPAQQAPSVQPVDADQLAEALDVELSMEPTPAAANGQAEPERSESPERPETVASNGRSEDVSPAPASLGRAPNDPRVNPKPVRARIVTEVRERPLRRALDTSQEPAIVHAPRPIARPANDPRLARGAAQ